MGKLFYVDGNVSAAAMKKWEKAASAGVSLVAEAAEQLERAAAEKLGQTGPVLQVSRLCTTNDMEQEAPEDLNKLGPKETIEGDIVKSMLLSVIRNFSALFSN